MGTNGCFKIMACGRDPATEGDMEAAEGKASPDKRRWSFRRRHSKNNRVLSNILISEPLSVESKNKDSLEDSNNNFLPPTNVQISEKINEVKHFEEKPPLPLATFDSNVSVSDTVRLSNSNEDFDSSLLESAAIVIQTAIRRYLAQIRLAKLKSIVKLQAVVRGHFVRRQATDTFRCIRAILKLQSLVRARQMQLHAEKLANSSTEKGRCSNKPKIICSLTNFTRKILEPTPTKKWIYISCDPSKSDSSWKWLDRWMAVTVTLSNVGQEQQKLDLHTDCEGHGEQEFELPNHKASTEVDLYSIVKSKPDLCEIEVADDALLDTSDKIEFPISSPDTCSLAATASTGQSSIGDVLGLEIESHKSTAGEKKISDSNVAQLSVQSDITLQPEALNEVRGVDIEKSKRTKKKLVCEPLENENKKIAVGIKRSCNPAFVAVQSKFEELSATPTSGRPVSSRQSITAGKMPTDQVDEPDNLPNLDDISDALPNQNDSFTKGDFSFTESSLPRQPKVQTATSECGTEISISSTLDSPDRSEAEGGEIVLEIGALEKRHFDANGKSNNAFVNYASSEPKNSSNASVEGLAQRHSDANGDASNVCDLENINSELKISASISEAFQEQKIEQIDGLPDHSVSPIDSVPLEMATEQTASDMHVQNGNEISEQAHMLSHSLDGSPRSHITSSELHGTPSSQVSATSKNGKIKTNSLNKKPKSQIISKRSPSNNANSATKSSAEHLPKDTKNKKKRNSLGAGRPDFLDHEPRISSSSSSKNSLPSYMQATESAKAKLNASNSPKSSPDVHDKESYPRKRHSLPIGNGKNVSSPRIQPSMSHVQESSKGNGTPSPHNSKERKWQR